MTNPTASPADLLAENQRLVAENELLIKRNTELEARFMHFEASDGNKGAAPTCSACGTACAVCSTSSEIKNEVALPNELFRMIAEYFEPGTRDLSNFARTSQRVRAAPAAAL